ncbi:MAG TPA: LLM class flavin-dependent oxidoreductase [Amycolatopsis sp.]|nr:LLM class flavin-dependent oxidoreductase [Amycolatopsis sp.]
MNGIGRVGIWAGGFDALPIDVIREAAQAIEDLGYDALWLHETTGREIIAQAGILLAATRRIVVAAGGADIYARDAASAAAAQRTFDEAFPGRFFLGLWESHPGIAQEFRGHPFQPPLKAMRAYLDAMKAGPGRLIMALEPEMLSLASERTGGAHVLGMPVGYTRTARTVLGPDALLAVAQLIVLDADRARARELARATAEAALPNRRELLAGIDVDRLVDALVVHGTVDDVARRVNAHFEAGADHVSLYIADSTPGQAPVAQWRRLAAELL